MSTRQYLVAFLLSILIFTVCKQDTEKRKIKLSDTNTVTRTDEQLTTTIHLEPTMRRAIAVLFFENKTGDQNLEWLRRGLTEMFIRSLSQSKYLSVLSTDRVYEILEQLNNQTAFQGVIDVEMAAVVAEEADVEALLTGHIQKNGDSLEIYVKVHDPSKGYILKEESIEGSGMENLFSMVDQLTQKIKTDLQLTPGKEPSGQSITQLSTNSLEAWRYYTAGMELWNKAMHNDAAIQFEKAVELDTTFISAYYYLSFLATRLGEHQKGYHYLNKLRNLRNNATEKERYQIDLLEARMDGDFREILQVTLQWLEQYPDDRDANLYLAGLYFNMGMLDKAVHYYRKLLDIDPKNKMAYNDLGYIYAYKGDFSNARTIIDRYKEIAPAEPNPYDSMGEIYLFQGEYRKAEKQFKKAIRRNDLFYPAIFHLGESYLNKGQYSKALRTFQTFLEKTTDRASKSQALTQLALVSWRLGNKEQAISSIKSAMDNRDDPYRLTSLLNEIYLEENDSTRVNEALKQAYNQIKTEIQAEPRMINSLANLCLWYGLHIDETIHIINEILQQNDSKTIQVWGQFIRGLILMKYIPSRVSKDVVSDFTDEFMDRLKGINNIPYNYYTWKSYLIFNEYARRFPKEGIKKYKTLIEFCVENNLTIPEMIFRSFLSELFFHLGYQKKAQKELQMIGIPDENKWMLIGPFDNKNGFQKRFPPEKSIKLWEKYRERSHNVTWQFIKDGYREGYINLKQMYDHYNWSVAYGLIYVYSPVKKDVQFRTGSNDAIKVWLNDQEVWKMNKFRDAVFDNDIFPVSLEPGLNKILVKICNRIGEWGFYFRITDANGRGRSKIKFVSPDQVEK